MNTERKLTDEQIIEIAAQTKSAERGTDGYILPFTFARAIEAAVRKQDEALLRQAREALRGAANVLTIDGYATWDEDAALAALDARLNVEAGGHIVEADEKVAP